MQAELIAPYNPEMAKSLMAEAEIEEEPGREGRKELAKKSAEATVKRSEEQPAELAKVRDVVDRTDSMLTDIDALLEPDPGNPGGQRILSSGRGAVGSFDGHPWVPNIRQDTVDYAAKVDQLKSKLKIEGLQLVRDASKTGSGGGNITEAEWPIFESRIANLDMRQGEEQFAKQVASIKDYIQSLRDRVSAGYRDKYGETPIRTSIEAPAAPGQKAAARAAPGAPSVALTDTKKATLASAYQSASPEDRKRFVDRVVAEGADPSFLLGMEYGPTPPAFEKRVLSPTNRAGAILNARGR